MGKTKEIIYNSIRVKESMMNDKYLIKRIDQIVLECCEAIENGKSIYWCGNGGSAADSQHLAAELSGRFYYDREPIPSEALHCNTSYLTAVANDYGYEHVFSRLIKAIGNEGDILIGLSTSAKSKNIVNAFDVALTKDMITIGFCGEEMNDFDICDILLQIPSKDTPRIQEGHMLVGHIICQLIEEKIYPQ